MIGQKGLVENIRQELHLPEFGKPPEFSIPFHGFHCDRIGSILVDRDRSRINRVRLLQRLPEEPPGGSGVLSR
jgi:hypothetical protein